jgi:hypothetical protein
MVKGTKIALLAVTVLAAISTVLFLKQGGFGGGHGDFDKALFIIGLPWAGIPWPEMFIKHDFVWLIGLPFCLNLATVLLITAAVRAMRRSSPTAAN